MATETYTLKKKKKNFFFFFFTQFTAIKYKIS